KLQLNTLQWWILSQREGLLGLIDHFRNRDANVLVSLDDMPGSYRSWLTRFVKDGDFETLWKFFNRHGDRNAWLRVIRQLREVEREGSLARAVELLGYLKSDRMQDLATILQRWESSGELARFLSGVETLLEQR